MSHINNNINIIKNMRINNNEKNISINDSVNGTNLSQSIRIFAHKPNSIIGLKYNLAPHYSQKNIFEFNENSKDKNIIENKKYLLLNNTESKLKENKINIIKLEEEKLKAFKYNIFNKVDFQFSKNKLYKKHNSFTNIFYNNPSKLHDNINKVIKNEYRNKLLKNIEEAKFKISLLNDMLSRINNKYLFTKIKNNKIKDKENILLLIKNFKLETMIYQKKLYLYKLKLYKIQENSVCVNKLKENIQKEELSFKKQKCILIEKIIELSIKIHQNKKTFSFSIFEDYSLENDFDDISTDEMLLTKNNNILKFNKFCQSNFK